MNGITENTLVTINLNGTNTTLSWVEFASKLTQVPCANGQGMCSTSIAASESLDFFWVLFSAILLLFFQVGSIFLEVGSVCVYNTKNILVKNIGECCVSAICFYTIGFGLAFVNGNSFIGDSGFALTGEYFRQNDPNSPYEGYNYAYWLYQWAIVAAIISIISGAIAERVSSIVYFLYSVLIPTIVYPLLAHWSNSSNGFASPFRSTENRFLGVGVLDMSGGGVISITAGVFALIGCLAVGPRPGRFDSLGSPIDLPKQSESFQTIGVLLIWVSFYGLTCGSTLTLAGISAEISGVIAVNTTISASMSGLSSLFVSKILSPKESLDPTVLNSGILAGLVSVSSCCGTVESYVALVIGFIAGALYVLSSRLVLYLKIDDVTDAIAIYLFPGIFSMIAAGLTSSPELYAAAYGTNQNASFSCGAFYSCDGNGIKQLLANLVFVFLIVGWSSLFAALTFLPLKYAGRLNLSDDGQYGSDLDPRDSYSKSSVRSTDGSIPHPSIAQQQSSASGSSKWSLGDYYFEAPDQSQSESNVSSVPPTTNSTTSSSSQLFTFTGNSKHQQSFASSSANSFASPRSQSSSSKSPKSFTKFSDVVLEASRSSTDGSSRTADSLFSVDPSVIQSSRYSRSNTDLTATSTEPEDPRMTNSSYASTGYGVQASPTNFARDYSAATVYNSSFISDGDTEFTIGNSEYSGDDDKESTVRNSTEVSEKDRSTNESNEFRYGTESSLGQSASSIYEF